MVVVVKMRGEKSAQPTDIFLRVGVDGDLGAGEIADDSRCWEEWNRHLLSPSQTYRRRVERPW